MTSQYGWCSYCSSVWDFDNQCFWDAHQLYYFTSVDNCGGTFAWITHWTPFQVCDCSCQWLHALQPKPQQSCETQEVRLKVGSSFVEGVSSSSLSPLPSSLSLLKTSLKPSSQPHVTCSPYSSPPQCSSTSLLSSSWIQAPSSQQTGRLEKSHLAGF